MTHESEIRHHETQPQERIDRKTRLMARIGAAVEEFLAGDACECDLATCELDTLLTDGKAKLPREYR